MLPSSADRLKVVPEELFGVYRLCDFMQAAVCVVLKVGLPLGAGAISVHAHGTPGQAAEARLENQRGGEGVVEGYLGPVLEPDFGHAQYEV